mgnify:FL=1
MEDPAPRKRSASPSSGRNGALSIPAIPTLKKAVSKSANTSREPSPTRITLPIPLTQEKSTRKRQANSRSCPGSPPGKSPKRKEDMMEEEIDTGDNLRIFSTPNDKIKAFWIIPIKGLSGKHQKRIEVKKKFNVLQ